MVTAIHGEATRARTPYKLVRLADGCSSLETNETSLQQGDALFRHLLSDEDCNIYRRWTHQFS